MHDGWKHIMNFTQPPIFFKFTLWTWTKFVSSEGNNKIPGFSWCFKVLRRRLVLVRRFSMVLSDKKMSFPYHLRPLKKFLKNHTSAGGLINMKLYTAWCPPRFFIYTTDEFRRLDNVISLPCRFLYERVTTSNLVAFSSLLNLKTNYLASFKNTAISKSECLQLIRKWPHASTFPQLV